VIKECSHPECSFCHAELDSASHVVVCHVKRKVGKIPNRLGLLLHSDKSLILLSQPFAMSSLLRRSASLQPTQNPQVWNDNSPNGEGNGINSITNLSSYRPNALTPLAKIAFTMAGGGQAAPIFGLMARRIAFTMAEILLSLTIIGVVAAITLPSLTGNINERTWNTQRKALYARMSQAIALMPSMNGYGIGATDEETIANATETFVTAGLSKVLKINNVCDGEHLSDCGLPQKITTLMGSEQLDLPKTYYAIASYNMNPDDRYDIDTKAAGLETQNGESMAVYYQPRCRMADVESIEGPNGEQGFSSTIDFGAALCVNFVYDLNGNKGPNTVGKDIGFMSVFSPYDAQVAAPVLDVSSFANSKNFSDATAFCRQRGDDYRLPSVYELASISINQSLIGGDIFSMYLDFWSGTPASTMLGQSGVWSMAFDGTNASFTEKTYGRSVFCVKR